MGGYGDATTLTLKAMSGAPTLLAPWVTASIHPLPCTRKVARTPSQDDELEMRGSVLGSELTGAPHAADVSSTSIMVPKGTVKVARLFASVTRM